MDLTFNKIAGAGLATALVIASLAVIPPIFFEKHPPHTPGYKIDAPEETAGGAEAADVPPDWGTVLPAADIAAGEAKAAGVCSSCHKFDPAGTNAIGPGLYGVVGRAPGTHPGFAYSDPMKGLAAKTPKWDYDHLYEFIHGPGKYLPGTKMTYVGLKAPQDRINVIAYLHSLGSTLPVPAPKPAAAPPAEPAAASAGAAGKAAEGPQSGVAPTPAKGPEPAHPGGGAGGPNPPTKP